MKAADGSPLSVVSLLLMPRIVTRRPEKAWSMCTFGRRGPISAGLMAPRSRRCSPLTTLTATGVRDASAAVRWAVTTTSGTAESSF